MKLLPEMCETAWDLDYARSIECPQCGWGAIWLYNTQRCFCSFCRDDPFDADWEMREWDRIDIYAPILMDGSGVAA